MFEAGIGTSQNWDPVQAGSEVIQQALKDLSKPPKFVLLFSTIHYDKDKGLQKILDTVYHFIPKETPLIGGTVSGFMNNSGCFTRGLTALACYSDEMDVAIGLGKNTKRNPKKAVKELLNETDRLQSRFPNEVYFTIISGGKIPFIPFLKQGRVVFSKLLGKIESMFIPLILFLFQKGVGREEELLKSIVSTKPNASLFSISTMDNEKMEKNYQFFNNKIVTDAIIGLKIATLFKSFNQTEHGLAKTNKTFTVTKLSKDKRIIEKINGKSPREEFLRVLGWPGSYLDELIYRKIFFYPLAYSKEGFDYPFIPGLFLGDQIVSTYQLETNEISVLSASGKALLDAVKKSTDAAPNNILFFMTAECGIRLETLGSKLLKSREIMLNKLGKKPFLSLYVGGEATYSKEKGLRFGNDTFNIVALYA